MLITQTYTYTQLTLLVGLELVDLTAAHACLALLDIGITEWHANNCQKIKQQLMNSLGWVECTGDFDCVVAQLLLHVLECFEFLRIKVARLIVPEPRKVNTK